MAHSRSTRARRCWLAAVRMVAIGGIAAALAGCNTTQQASSEYPNDYRQRHPIALKNGQNTVEVFLGQHRGGLNPAQRADVLSFAQSWKRDATSGILVEVPKGAHANRIAADSLREIHSIFAASGVPRAGVRVRSYQSADAGLPSIKLNYSRLVADVAPCGTWPNDVGTSLNSGYSSNRSYWDLGCASQRNLAAMVDNPADLVQPRGETPAYAARRSVMMDKFRKGEAPSGTYPSDSGNGYDNGKISDVGK